MTTTPTATPVALSHEQIAELLDLLKDSDSVELKLTVPEHDQRSAVVALGMDPLEAQIRQVFFFDTPDLALDKLGVVVRAPAHPGQGRRLGREAAAGRAVGAPGGAARLDRLPRRGRRAARRLRLLGDAEADARRRRGQEDGGRRAPGAQALLEAAARALRRACAEGSSSTTCRSSGRSSCSSCASRPKELGRRLVAEMWIYPDGSRVLELSTRAATNEAFQVAAEARAFLARPRRRPLRRAADEDEEGARVLRGGAQERELSRRARGSHPGGSGARSARASVTPRPASVS